MNYGICYYTPVENTKTMRSGCTPVREWIPQINMKYCPFCGDRISRVTPVRNIDKLPDQPDPGSAA